MESPLSFPRSAIELFKLLPEGILCQVINDAIYVSRVPDVKHQEIVGDILAEIHGYIKKTKKGDVALPYVDVLLNSKNAFQPDMMVILKSNLSIVRKDGKIHGAPNVIIEVMDRFTKKDDMGRKKKVYEKCGVSEYFVVDQYSKNVFTHYLKNGKFFEKEMKKGKIVSRMLKKTFKF